jgi:hypothetical protein
MALMTLRWAKGSWGERSTYSGPKAVQISRRVGMIGVSLPALTRCLVEKEDSIDASWKGANSVLPPQRLT